MVKQIVLSIFLLIGGFTCLTDTETISTGIVLLLIATVIIALKVRKLAIQDKENEALECRSTSIRSSEYTEYLQQFEKYEVVERKWKKLVDRHYKLIEEIGIAYTVANNLSLPNSMEMEHVVNLCKKDIELAEGFKQYWNDRNQAMVQSGYYASTDISNALPNYSSFKRLAIIYEKQKRYDEAIAVCQKAIDLGFSNDGTEGQMPGRIARLMRKKGKEAKKLSESEQIIIEE